MGVPQHLAALLLCNLENSLRPFEVARLNVLILLLWNSLLGLDFQVCHISNFPYLDFRIICTSSSCFQIFLCNIVDWMAQVFFLLYTVFHIFYPYKLLSLYNQMTKVVVNGCQFINHCCSLL